MSTALISCASIGPGKVQKTAQSYSDVLMQQTEEQVLRNLVRRRYGEPPQFIKITAITASFALSTSYAPTASWDIGAPFGTNPNTSLVQSLGIAPTMSYSDAPTISYSPMDSVAFINMLEEPINFKFVAVLSRSETNYIELLGNLIFSNVGVLANTASNDGSLRIEISQEYQNFQLLLRTLSSMIISKAATISLITFQDQPGLLLHINKEAVDSPQANLVKKLLGHAMKFNDIVFLNEPDTTINVESGGAFVPAKSLANFDSNLTYVSVRSIASIIGFLAHAVKVPESDIKSHIARAYEDTEGKEFDWNKILDNIMTIYSSDTEPKNVLVKTFLHDHWFYIKMSDHTSKYTFTVLMKLMALAIAISQPLGAVQTAPLITVNAGAAR